MQLHIGKKLIGQSSSKRSRRNTLFPFFKTNFLNLFPSHLQPGLCPCRAYLSFDWSLIAKNGFATAFIWGCKMLACIPFPRTTSRREWPSNISGFWSPRGLIRLAKVYEGHQDRYFHQRAPCISVTVVAHRVDAVDSAILMSTTGDDSPSSSGGSFAP